jgi:hypothetical protein
MSRPLKPLVLCSALLLTMAWSSTARPAPDAKPGKKKKPTSEASKPAAKPDTLQACLDKIPKNATLGQRLLAEQSCKREEEQRKQSGEAARF